MSSFEIWVSPLMSSGVVGVRSVTVVMAAVNRAEVELTAAAVVVS